MKKIQVLKYMISIFFFIFINQSFVLSQTNNSKVLFTTKNNTLSKEEFARTYSLKPENIEEFFPIEFNKEILIDGINMSFKIGEKLFSVNKTKLINRSQDLHSFYGKIEGTNEINVIITMRQNYIAGVIYLNNAKYNIVTMKDMNNYLLKTKKYFDCGQNKNTSNIDQFQPKKADILRLKSTNVNSSNMRIIVMYTPAADALFSDMLTSVQNSIDDANGYLGNSEVEETWELAYTGLTDYTEVYEPDPGDGRFEDLDNFHYNYDGYMDEVHDLRETYSADICVLISECQYATKCGGVAVWVDANSSQAFCLVHAATWGEIPDQIFSHEIGHLLGCRHPDDNESTPYSYGHGFYDNQNNFQTIMGEIWNIDLAPNFSNPDVLYNYHVTGTSNWNDCARVLETEIPEKTAFFQPANSVSINSTDVNNMLYGDVISEQTVYIQNATISSGSILKVRSDEITLDNDFTVELGAELEIVIE